MASRAIDQLPNEIWENILKRSVDSRGSKCVLMRVCPQWRAILGRMLYRHVVLSDAGELDLFASNSPDNLLSSILTLTIFLHEDYAPEPALIVHTVHPSIDAINALAHRIRHMSRLESLSISRPDKIHRPDIFVKEPEICPVDKRLPYSCLEHLVTSLPPSCRALEIDFIACHADIHLCPILSRQAKRLWHIRLRLPYLCDELLRLEQPTAVHQYLINTTLYRPEAIDPNRCTSLLCSSAHISDTRKAPLEHRALQSLILSAEQLVSNLEPGNRPDLRIVSQKHYTMTPAERPALVRHDLRSLTSCACPLVFFGKDRNGLRMPLRSFVTPWKDVNRVIEGDFGWQSSTTNVRLPVGITFPDIVTAPFDPATETQFREAGVRAGSRHWRRDWAAEDQAGEPLLVPEVGKFSEQPFVRFRD